MSSTAEPSKTAWAAPKPAFAVPTTAVGGRKLPRVFLGDHGFLRRYGSSLSDGETEDRMRFAAESAGLGLAAGDERCLRIAAAVRGRYGCAVLYHTDAPLALDGHAVGLDRCMASLWATLIARAPHAVEDPIVGTYLASFAHGERYTQSEAARLTIDDGAWREEIRRVRQHRPVLVTVGGDTLDLALALGRLDLVTEVLVRYRSLLNPSSEAVLVFTTYFGPLVAEPSSLQLGTLVDATMLPINRDGLGMLPHAEGAWRWARALQLPLVAMHPLGAGRIDAAPALEYVLRELNVPIAIVGASRYVHIQALTLAVQDMFGSESR